MASSEKSLFNRVSALPGQFVVALINATAILVIVACVLVLLTLNRVDAVAGNLAGTVTDAALAQLDMTPQGLRDRLEKIEQRAEDISKELQDPSLSNSADLRSELAELNASLGQISSAFTALATEAPDMKQAAFRQAGQTITDLLLGFSGCNSLPSEAKEPGA